MGELLTLSLNPADSLSLGNDVPMGSEHTASDQVKAEFLAGISRVVHSTMNGVIGMLDIALDEQVSDKVKDCLLAARSSANALVALVNDIVDMSCLDTGQMQIEPRHCALAEILTDIDSLLNAQMTLRGQAFEMSFVQAVPATVYTDPVRLRQCLLDMVYSTVAEFDDHDVAMSLTAESDADDCWVRFDMRHCRTRDCSEEQDVVCRSYWQRLKAIDGTERRPDRITSRKLL